MSVEETQALEGAAAEPVAESSSPAIDSPVASDSEAVPSPVGGAVEAATDEAMEPVKEEPELPEFDFSAWGGGADDLPEMYHGVHGRMEELFGSKFGALESDMDQLRRLNDALMVGEEDPRVADFQSKYEAEISAREGVQREYEQYRAEVDASLDRDAASYAQNFKQKHSEIFEDPEKREALAILIENQWDPEVGVKLLGLDRDTMKVALEAKRDGVPDLYALRLAENASRPRPKSDPRPAAKITSGATTRSSPDQQMMDINETSSLDDKRMIVARRALKNARR
jgi:hypothetical protein